MPRDFEDLEHIDDLSDDELRLLVRQHLADHNGLDLDDLTVAVRDGEVFLGGRVGTDGERLVAEHIVTDVVGAPCRNEIFVVVQRRAESPEAIDDHLVDEAKHEGLLLGDRAMPISPETETLEEDLDADQFGTTDILHAIQEGNTWVPPTVPTQEGLVEGREHGEEH